MGVGGGKGAPAPPNFSGAATPNQTNAAGATSQWAQGPDGKWSQNSSFGGPAGDAVKSMQGQLAGAWGTPLDNGAGARTNAENAIYGSETSRLDPRFQQGEQQLQTQLANQGLTPGSEAYNNAYQNFQRSKNDAYQQAQYGAVMGGGQEAQRQQQMDLTSRFAPEQGLAGMQAMSGQSQNPLLTAAIAQYQGDLQKYGIQQSGKNSMMSGLSSLGGDVALAASDPTRKEDVHQLGVEQRPGVPLVSWRYRGDSTKTRFTGVLTSDLKKAGLGHKVFTRADGLEMVDGNDQWLKPIPVGTEDD